MPTKRKCVILLLFRRCFYIQGLFMTCVWAKGFGLEIAAAIHKRCLERGDQISKSGTVKQHITFLVPYPD